MASSAPKEPVWPLGFRVSPSTSTGPRFWSHELYRGKSNQPVKIMYSRSKMESEQIAQEFLQERVLGFDMEWPWQNKDLSDVPLQQRIGLIQIASEDKIALFHIGLHVGRTAKDVLAPTLRQIIESEDITKTGVGILSADFSRLHRWFGLRPRGAFELSHFHNLVTYGARHPHKVTTRMKALSKLVEEHLGLPLYKGKVRTSNWSRPLNRAQVLYAAADAYAGVMLYYCINAKRLAMDPTPPLPLHSETYLPMRQGMGSILPVQLGSLSKDTSGVSAVEFYHHSRSEEDGSLFYDQNDGILNGEDEDEKQEESLQDMDAMLSCDQAASTTTNGDPSGPGTQLSSPNEQDMGLVVVGRRGRQLLLEKRREVDTASKVLEPRRPEYSRQTHSLDTVSESRMSPESAPVSRPVPFDPETTKALFARLSAHRKRIAKERRCAAFIIAHNTVLSAISENCPQNEQQLRQIPGIGKVKAELYGPDWLAIVLNFLEEQTAVALSDEQGVSSPAPTPATPNPRRTQTEKAIHEASNGRKGIPASLHTGLSFKMVNASLESDSNQQSIETSGAFSAFRYSPRSLSPSNLKRKRDILDASSERQNEPCLVLPRPGLRLVTDTMWRPDLQATTRSSPSATTAGEAILRHADNMHTPLAGQQHVTRSQNFSPHGTPQGPAPTSKHQTLREAQIFRNKLLAFNKRVTATVILSNATIERIIQNPPKSAQEMLQIPDIIPFANACARQKQCLLTFILKTSKEPALSAI